MRWNRVFQGGYERRAVRKLTTAIGISLALVIATVSASRALAPTVDLSKDAANVVVSGALSDGYMGEVTGAGDFNGDGYADLLLGAGGHNRNGQFSGAAYMIPGGPSMPAAFDLKSAPAQLEIYGQAANHALGHAVAGGDLNGDGITDIIVAADGWGDNRGVVYVVLGRAGLSGVIEVTTVGAANLAIVGEMAGDRFGRSVASGDVNGDGVDDLIVGAYTVTRGGRAEAGAVYIFLGGANLFTNPVIDMETNKAAALVILGPEGDPDGNRPASGPQTAADMLFDDALKPEETGQFGSRLGRSVAAGDINGDNREDMIVSGYGTNVGGAVDAGKTYVIYGDPGIFDGRTWDLATTPPNLTLSGVAANDQAGFFVATGKLNLDIFADIVIGAYTSAEETGKVFVMYGSGSLAGEVPLVSANVVISGLAKGDRLGRSLATGDVNKDGVQDLIVGASRADPGGRSMAGEAYLFFGGSLKAVSSPNDAYVRIYGQAGGGQCDSVQEAANKDCGDEAGHSVAAGDLNGDGYAEIIVGALYNNNGAAQDAGAVYVLNGAGSVTPGTPGPIKTRLFLPSVTNLRPIP